ncbi:MAG: CHAD domain-containing protein [Chloroflexi bacterium]|nr:CHAD domain-containing protein [Chloroflexota bacterium]
MSAQPLLLDSLTSRWKRYKTELKNCRDEFSEEAVHDFRVAARRLLASLDLLQAIIHGAKTKKIRRILKDQLDNLDELRDAQVMLADIAENIQKNPSLKPFEEYLQRREKKLMRAARRGIKSLKIGELAKRMRKLEEAVGESQPDGLDPLPAVDESYARVIQRYGKVDPAQSATIHRLRIAFKKFRYMVESIHPTLKGFPEDTLKRMHDYQTSMGEIQDMEAALQELAEFEKTAPKGYDPEPVRAYYREQHALAISRYLEDRGEITAFWRAAPDQPFPKENQP